MIEAENSQNIPENSLKIRSADGVFPKKNISQGVFRLYRIIPLVFAGIRRDFRFFLALRELHGTGIKREIFEKSNLILLNFNYLINRILIHESVCPHTASLRSGLLHSLGYGKRFLSDGFHCQWETTISMVNNSSLSGGSITMLFGIFDHF